MSEQSREYVVQAGLNEMQDAPMDRIDALFPHGCWLRTQLPPGTRTHPASSVSVAELARQVAGPRPPFINTTSYSATIHIADATTPRVPVDIRPPNDVAAWITDVRRVLAAGIPWPTDSAGSWVKPNGGTDGTLVVAWPDWQSADGKLRGAIWELWGATPPDPATGHAKAWTGGRMLGTKQRITGRGINRGNTATAADWTWTGTGEQSHMMTSATAIPLASTVVRVAELKRGIVRHPLGFGYNPAIPSEVVPSVWPAIGWDSASCKQLPEGARFRLPHNWSISPAKPRIVRILEATARDHGLVAVDTSDGVALRLEPGSEPYFGGLPRDQIMRAFPWTSLVRLEDGSDTCPTPT